MLYSHPRRLRIPILLLHCLSMLPPSWGDFASLSLATDLPTTSNVTHEVAINFTTCAYYNPSHASPPYQSYHRLDHFHHAVYPSDDQESNYGCSMIPSNASKASLHNSILLVDRGKCSFYKKAWLAQEQGASLLIVMFNKSQLPFGPRLVPTDMPNMTTQPISIPVLFVMNETGEEIKSWVSNSTAVYLNGYVTSRSSNYWSIGLTIVVLFAIATATLMLSTYLSYSGYQFLWYGFLFRPETSQMFTTESSSVARPVTTELYDVIKSLLVACVVLLLLYFFHTLAVSVVLLWFCFLAVLGLYNVLAPFAALIPFGNGDKFRVPPNELFILKYRPSVMFFITVAFCVAVTLTWFIYRHSSYAWVLHNLLGFGLMSLLMYYNSFDKVWVVSIYMVLVFVYDIFFVFVTPYFTSDGVSVMERAVVGNTESSEKLPIMFVVPSLNYLFSQSGTCAAHFGMKGSSFFLGYGDVYIPGLLVSLSLKFDRKSHPNSCKIYYFTSSIAYMVGLVGTFLALFLSQSAQPALLYLVPTTLGSVFILSLLRREFNLFFFEKRRTGVKHNNRPAATPQHRRRRHHGHGSRRRRRGHYH